MVTTISSQRFLDEAIVEIKRAARDYNVLVSPEFEIGGETYRVVLDGHHSLAAAREDGVEPEYREATNQDIDSLLILAEDPEYFLQINHLGDDYYDIADGSLIW